VSGVVYGGAGRDSGVDGVRDEGCARGGRTDGRWTTDALGKNDENGLDSGLLD